MILKYASSLVVATLLALGVAKAEDAAPKAENTTPKKYDTGMIPSPHIILPTGKVVGEVVLISDAAGWGDKEDAIAKNIVAQGAMVIGIDYPALLTSLN